MELLVLFIIFCRAWCDFFAEKFVFFCSLWEELSSGSAEPTQFSARSSHCLFLWTFSLFGWGKGGRGHVLKTTGSQFAAISKSANTKPPGCFAGIIFPNSQFAFHPRPLTELQTTTATRRKQLTFIKPQCHFCCESLSLLQFLLKT